MPIEVLSSYEKPIFTSERCNVKAMNPFESELMQTHHKKFKGKGGELF